MCDLGREKKYLRDLSQRYIELAHMPIMAERADLWQRHNRLQGERPVIVMEALTFEHELLPAPRCESDFGRRMEKELQRHIINYEMIGDDKVVPDYFTVYMDLGVKTFGLESKREYAKDATGRELGWREEHFIKDLEEDLPKLSHSKIIYDKAKTDAYIDFVKDILGDWMPIQLKNSALDWIFGISGHVVRLMGMEALMYAIYDCPECVKRLYEFVCNDLIDVLREMERANLLTLNNGNDYAGAGSYGFCDELEPKSDSILSSTLWGNLNSQETVSISPEMFGDFVFPAYECAAREFGLVYFGCCEPVHPIWEKYISKLPNLRKVSVSPWCDESYMGEALRGSRVIYSRKPTPNFLGVGRKLDEEAYGEHIANTLRAAKGCTLEIIHRDVYTLSGNPNKLRNAVQIARKKIDGLW